MTFGSGQESYNVTTTTQDACEGTLSHIIADHFSPHCLFTSFLTVKHPDTRAGPYGLKGFTQSSPKTIYTILPNHLGSRFMIFFLLLLFFFHHNIFNKILQYCRDDYWYFNKLLTQQDFFIKDQQSVKLFKTYQIQQHPKSMTIYNPDQRQQCNIKNIQTVNSLLASPV